MDIDEWEFLPDGGYLDFNEVGGGENQIFFGKRNNNSVSKPSSVLDSNYFCTSPKSRNQRIHVPIQLEQPRFENNPPDEEEEDAESQDTVSSQVFFKIKENEFDMKLDSPKGEMVTSPKRMKIEKKEMMEYDKEEEVEVEEEEDEDDHGGLNNIWKWGLTGVGAIFSFGVAAATVCVLFFGTKQRNKLQQEHKIRFQIYTDDKRLKQVVQQATKLSVPLSRAHITYGGYYDGL